MNIITKEMRHLFKQFLWDRFHPQTSLKLHCFLIIYYSWHCQERRIDTFELECDVLLWLMVERGKLLWREREWERERVIDGEASNITPQLIWMDWTKVHSRIEVQINVYLASVHTIHSHFLPFILICVYRLFARNWKKKCVSVYDFAWQYLSWWRRLTYRL